MLPVATLRAMGVSPQAQRGSSGARSPDDEGSDAGVIWAAAPPSGAAPCLKSPLAGRPAGPVTLQTIQGALPSTARFSLC